jgi:hypothetical protein
MIDSIDLNGPITDDGILNPLEEANERKEFEG